MIVPARRAIALLTVLTLLVATAPGVSAAPPPPPPPGPSEAPALGRTPPRLSYLDGNVSFWRPGATDWTPAEVNLPLAPGDELYTGEQGNVELQIGARAFVRAAAQTQFGITNQDPDFLQLKITAGHIGLDLRSVEPGHSVELDTPHGAFTIEHAGYYRADVSAERISFIARRAGRATMTSEAGQAVLVAPSEEIVLEGADTPQLQSYVAPDTDAWDQWNYARTDYVFEALSARYVSPGTYGVDELDHYGSWRVVPEYGSVWVPAGVPAGWAPYSTGQWIMDPFYGWTWIDTAPWGWAPYHYGRWVVLSGLWAWAPGPIVLRPAYAPALVAFFSAPGIRVGVEVAPAVSWVALGWGEPVVPWWGRPSFAGRPWWGGWGGPRVVNNVVVNRTTVVNVNNITVYRNTSATNAVVTVRQEHFGARPVQEARIADGDVKRLQPVRGAPAVRPQPASFVAANDRAARPPEPALARRVVATRPPERAEPGSRNAAPHPAAVVNPPAPRVVQSPRAAVTPAVPARPPFGTSQAERDRQLPAPRFEPRAVPRAAEPRQSAPHVEPPPIAHEANRPAPVVAASRPASRALPGEPANRLAPHRAPAPAPHPGGAPSAGGHPGAAPPREHQK